MAFQALALAKEIPLSDNVREDRRGVSIEEIYRMNEFRKGPLSQPEFPAEKSLADLISRSRQGDALAVEAIYLKFKNSLFNLAYRYTYDRAAAEDLLQDIFFKIFSHLEDVQKAETFVGWVYRIALNTCYSYLRGKKAELHMTVPLSEVEGTLEEDARNVRGIDLRKPLEEAISQLPHKLKRIFVLHDVQGFKHEEIARMLALSIGTSKSQLFKARMKIRNFLKDKQIVKEAKL